jgi:hypothetical protein
MNIDVLKQHDELGWITILADDRWVQAKVYSEPSIFGVNDCRVSKIAIAKKGVKLLGVDSGLNFFDNLDYNYDRGLDFHNDELLQETLDEILEWLNELPTLD